MSVSYGIISYPFVLHVSWNDLDFARDPFVFVVTMPLFLRPCFWRKSSIMPMGGLFIFEEKYPYVVRCSINNNEVLKIAFTTADGIVGFGFGGLYRM